MFICLSILVLLAVGFAFLNPRLWQSETEVPGVTSPDHQPVYSASTRN